jgi:uncharacterized protein YgiM (DUF1202 family)
LDSGRYEKVDGLLRNEWTISAGIGGRLPPELMDDFPRIMQTLQVSVDTNCRSGPGKAYDILTILRIGKTAEVVARNYNSSYWVINNPLGSGQCWVWGYYADVTGPAASLPVWDNPPTPTPTP